MSETLLVKVVPDLDFLKVHKEDKLTFYQLFLVLHTIKALCCFLHDSSRSQLYMKRGLVSASFEGTFRQKPLLRLKSIETTDSSAAVVCSRP